MACFHTVATVSVPLTVTTVLIYYIITGLFLSLAFAVDKNAQDVLQTTIFAPNLQDRAPKKIFALRAAKIRQKKIFRAAREKKSKKLACFWTRSGGGGS